jgi:histidinol-phosphate/aromatic aminotransferase/cobyric acid decarboxylase-like protein
MSRDVIAAMTAYTLELREAEIKLNQNESPFDLPRPLKDEVLARVAERPWNIYPDFESMALRGALATAYGYTPENVLVGNGSNELLAAAIGAFVGPGTPVIFPKPTFSLYEKLITVACGTAIPIAVDPTTGQLPLEEMLGAIEKVNGFSSHPSPPAPPPASGERGGDGFVQPVVIVCSPNNPTGGVLPAHGIDALLATGATVLFDRAYGDFEEGERGLPPLHDRLVTFSTFSKAWALAGLRVGWLASTAATCREIRKVKLPYSLNIISEAVAATALDHRELRDANVARTLTERARVFAAMQKLVTPYPSQANFIAFTSGMPAKPLFEALVARGVLIRDISSAVPNALRVSIGSREQNDRFLLALGEIIGERAKGEG